MYGKDKKSDESARGRPFYCCCCCEWIFWLNENFIKRGRNDAGRNQRQLSGVKLQPSKDKRKTRRGAPGLKFALCRMQIFITEKINTKKQEFAPCFLDFRNYR